MKKFHGAVAILGSFAFAYAIAVAANENTAPSSGAPAASSASGAARIHKIDINTADAAALEQLPGVGTEFANAIIASRPFKSVDELARVPGFGAAKARNLREKVIASSIKVSAAGPDASATSKVSKPSTVNEGKATDRQEVTERYEDAAPHQPAAGDQNK